MDQVQNAVELKAGEELVQRINLDRIFITHNPRSPAKNLQDAVEQMEEYKNWQCIDLVRNLALSEKPEDRAKYVELIETYESGEREIVELAASRRKGEAAPVLLRAYTVVNKENNNKEERYSVISGERRVLAAAYNHAKHDDKPVVSAIVRRISLAAAEDIAFDENHQRKPMTDLEIGEFIHKRWEHRKAQLKQGWEKKGKPTKKPPFIGLQEIADELGMEYQFALGREALHYLPEEEKKRLESGKIGYVTAKKMAMACKQGKTPDSVPDAPDGRRRVKTLKQVEELFDNNRQRKEYCEALADVMNVAYAKACKESDKRIKEKSAA